MEEQKLGVPHAIIIAGLIIALAIFLSGQTFGIVKNQEANPYRAQEIMVAPVTEDDHIRGNRNAKIAVIEFSDTECPFCKRFHPTVQKLIKEKGDEVLWVYRHFPIEALHRKAKKEAEAAECAAEQGGNAAFWNYIDKIFEITPANDGLDPAELPNIAAGLGLDVKKFNTCLASGKHAGRVEADMEDGARAGVTGTPSSIIVNIKNGKKVLLVGAESYENLLRAIDSVK